VPEDFGQLLLALRDDARTPTAKLGRER
jgi:hypothetical protein